MERSGPNAAYEDFGLLYIKPTQIPSEEPVIDEATCKMTYAFRNRTAIPIQSCGVHVCSCGIHSTSQDYAVSDDHMTNSLCIHYLAMHRDEVPQEMIDIVLAFDCEPEEPTADEIHGHSVKN